MIILNYSLAILFLTLSIFLKRIDYFVFYFLLYGIIFAIKYSYDVRRISKHMLHEEADLYSKYSGFWMYSGTNLFAVKIFSMNTTDVNMIKSIDIKELIMRQKSIGKNFLFVGLSIILLISACAVFKPFEWHEGSSSR
jgi:hypothetical protein